MTTEFSLNKAFFMSYSSIGTETSINPVSSDTSRKINMLEPFLTIRLLFISTGINFSLFDVMSFFIGVSLEERVFRRSEIGCLL
jgi:hypothetical protein